MALKVAINGFGRIGRLVFRAAVKNPNIEFVGINDLVPPDNLAYLLKHDSTHGRYNGTVEAREDGIVVDGKFVQCVSIKNPAELPWGKNGADYVVESTGLFTDYAGAENHLKAGAKRVILSAPTKDPEKVPTYLVGVNHTKFDPAKDKIVSNASCTTNCLAPVAKVINDNFGLDRGPDGDDPRRHRDPADPGRPQPQGLARRPQRVHEHHPVQHRRGQGGRPGPAGAEGQADRHGLPRADVGRLGRRPDLQDRQGDQLQGDLRRDEGRRRRAMEGILGYTDEEVVSSDFITDPRSSIFDAGAGIELNANFFKVVSWYDNEWGYSNRVIDLMLHMAKKDGIVK